MPVINPDKNGSKHRVAPNILNNVAVPPICIMKLFTGVYALPSDEAEHYFWPWFLRFEFTVSKFGGK